LVFWCIFGEKISGLENDSDPEFAAYAVLKKFNGIPFRFPLDLSYDLDGSFFITTSGFNLNWAGVTMPFKRLQISGRLNQDLVLQPGATAYFETPIKEIPLFGPLLKAMNVVNKDGNFMTAGTYRLEKAKGPALEPFNASIKSVEVAGNEIRVALSNASKNNRPLNEQFISIALINLETSEAIKQDYQNNITIKDSEANDEVLVIQKIEKKMANDILGKEKCLLIVLVNTNAIGTQII